MENSASIYSGLDPEQRQIRLLHVQPGDLQEEISCQLTVASLNDPAIIKYEVRLQLLMACEMSVTSGIGTFICLGCNNPCEAHYSEFFAL